MSIGLAVEVWWSPHRTHDPRICDQGTLPSTSGYEVLLCSSEPEDTGHHAPDQHQRQRSRQKPSPRGGFARPELDRREKGPHPRLSIRTGASSPKKLQADHTFATPDSPRKPVRGLRVVNHFTAPQQRPALTFSSSPGTSTGPSHIDGSHRPHSPCLDSLTTRIWPVALSRHFIHLSATAEAPLQSRHSLRSGRSRAAKLDTAY